jgi:predicted amino acid-binding ACT domain protein
MATKVTKVFNVTGRTVTESDVNKLIVRYLKLKQQQKEIEKELAELSSELKNIAQTQKDNKFTIKEHTVSISNCEKKTVSYKTLAENHPRIAKKLVTISYYTQLNVK